MIKKWREILFKKKTPTVTEPDTKVTLHCWCRGCGWECIADVGYSSQSEHGLLQAIASFQRRHDERNKEHESLCRRPILWVRDPFSDPIA